MSPIVSQSFIPGFLFLFTLLSGVWLSRSGRPLSVLIFTIHKLIALGTVVYTAVTLYPLYRTAGFSIKPFIMIVFAGLFFISLFASGALLSPEKPVNAALLTVHKAAPLLAAISTALAIYFLAI